ncbi:glutamate racemase [Polaromonas sp.]|uniref:glutamate racemase n=1 Tax=Polaromonas sp. TaxID=1869339 RepID=UPI0025E4512C|nr:glutamate racemase [Polaromonas sp.]
MKKPVGIFDSGIGGLSVLKALRAELPGEDFIYIADSGHAPYGERDDAHVISRSQGITRWLLAQDIQALVIACNTATAAAIHLLRAKHPVLPIIGVEPALKPAVPLSSTRRIGVMATRGTLASSKFRALLASQAGQADFVLQGCDGLADAIERSAASGDDAQVLAACKRHIEAMGRFGDQPDEIDTLVLGCTHYPFAEAQLRQLLGPQVQIISNGEAIARQTRRQLTTLAEAEHVSGSIRLLTTGDASALGAAAHRWLGLPAYDAALVNL